VEIDAQVVEVCKRFFPHLAGAFDDPRSRLLHDDGANYVATCSEKFQVILSDSSDPIGPAEVLFQRTFYQHVYAALAEDGIFVAQTESPFYHQDSVRKIYRNLRAVFPIVRMYLAHIPTYPSALWSFAFCSKGYDPIKDFEPSRVALAGLRYYNPALHQAAFALPNYVAELIE
jgi:spermidine synthase